MAIERAIQRRGQYRVPVERATILGVANLGASALYAVRRKDGQTIDGVPGPSGLKVGEGCTLGFKDSGNGQRYNPFIVDTEKVKNAEDVVQQNQSTSFVSHPK